MKNLVIISAFIACFIFSNNSAFGKIVVMSVKGEVAYKKGRQWTPLNKGQKLIEGTKISTGVRSSALIKIYDHTLRIHQLTMMKIYRNRSTKKRRDRFLPWWGIFIFVWPRQ